MVKWAVFTLYKSLFWLEVANKIYLKIFGLSGRLKLGFVSQQMV